ncbi:MAG: glycosyltransferase family 39 protein, partial [Bacteroidota bacterium]
MTNPTLHRPTLLGLLLLKAGLHILAIVNGYGLHRDEFLYLAEGSHPAWGYMEGPPVIGWAAGLSKLLFGSSALAAKVPVLLVGLASVYLLLRLVREFGGGRYAQLIAGTAWVLSPAFLGSNALFQPVSFNQFCWLLIGLALVRTIKYRRPQDWYVLGGVTGLALLTKYSVVFYLLALGVGLLLTPQRKLFLDKHLWRAASIAFVMWLPNLLWQYHYGFPVVSHMEELATTQLVNVSPADFLVSQFLFHWAGLVVWIPGLYVLFRRPELKDYRALGWAYPALILLLLALSGKAYYTIGIYASLLAAGGIFWESWLAARSRWLLPILAVSLFLAPYFL